MEFAFGRGRVQREDACFRHEIVHEAKDALLHLPSVLGPQNHHLVILASTPGQRLRLSAADAQGRAYLQIDVDAGGRGHSLGERVGREFTGIEDVEIWTLALELLDVGLVLGPHEHVPHEESVVRPARHDPNFDTILGIPASKAVDHIKAGASVEVIDGAVAVDVPGMLVEGDVHGTPPDVF